MNKAGILIAGYGYWDVTNYQYGGDFHRSNTNLKVTILEDLGPQYGYKAEFIDGLLRKHVIVSKHEAFIIRKEVL